MLAPRAREERAGPCLPPRLGHGTWDISPITSPSLPAGEGLPGRPLGFRGGRPSGSRIGRTRRSQRRRAGQGGGQGGVGGVGRGHGLWALRLAAWRGSIKALGPCLRLCCCLRGLGRQGGGSEPFGWARGGSEPFRGGVRVGSVRFGGVRVPSAAFGSFRLSSAPFGSLRPDPTAFGSTRPRSARLAAPSPWQRPPRLTARAPAAPEVLSPSGAQRRHGGRHAGECGPRPPRCHRPGPGRLRAAPPGPSRWGTPGLSPEPTPGLGARPGGEARGLWCWGPGPPDTEEPARGPREARDSPGGQGGGSGSRAPCPAARELRRGCGSGRCRGGSSRFVLSVSPRRGLSGVRECGSP